MRARITSHGDVRSCLLCSGHYRRSRGRPIACALIAVAMLTASPAEAAPPSFWGVSSQTALGAGDFARMGEAEVGTLRRCSAGPRSSRCRVLATGRRSMRSSPKRRPTRSRSCPSSTELPTGSPTGALIAPTFASDLLGNLLQIAPLSASHTRRSCLRVVPHAGLFASTVKATWLDQADQLVPTPLPLWEEGIRLAAPPCSCFSREGAATRRRRLAAHTAKRVCQPISPDCGHDRDPPPSQIAGPEVAGVWSVALAPR